MIEVHVLLQIMIEVHVHVHVHGDVITCNSAYVISFQPPTTLRILKA